MPLEMGVISEGLNSTPCVSEVVLGSVPDFINFHIHLPTFLWQLQCFVERIISGTGCQTLSVIAAQ